MKTFTYAAALAVTLGLLGGTTLGAQQPAPRQGPPAGAPEPQGQEMRRMPGPGPGFPGFAVMMFDPSRLLERRELLGLTADQVTKLSGLENDLKTARDKAQTDAKPHREELEKLLQGSAPDVAQVRTHAQALMQAEQGAQLATLATSVQAKGILTPEQRGRVQGWAEGGRMGLLRGRPRPGFGTEGPRGPGGPGGVRPLMRMRRAPRWL